jgi:flagellar basal body-associated protein FliL
MNPTIIWIIVAVAVVALVVYFLMNKKEGPSDTPPSQEPPSDNPPQSPVE